MHDGRSSTLAQRHSQGLMVVLFCILICIYFDLPDNTTCQHPASDINARLGKAISIQNDKCRDEIEPSANNLISNNQLRKHELETEAQTELNVGYENITTKQIELDSVSQNNTNLVIVENMNTDNIDLHYGNSINITTTSQTGVIAHTFYKLGNNNDTLFASDYNTKQRLRLPIRAEISQSLR